MTVMIGISLTGRQVVLVGAGSVSARRAQRFLDEGAHVTIVAPEAGEAIRALVQERRVHYKARRVFESDVAGAWLVHTATGDPAIDAQVARWCEQRHIFCVNASDGAHSAARLTAETRSGDLIAGFVSDVGVDPRRTMRVRDAVADLFRSGSLPVRRNRTGSRLGRVDLVGGGPGAADLMTVRGRRLLAEADVIVTDRLGPIEVLGELDPEALIIDVGKVPGNHSVPQERINEIIVEHALAGKRVVRLKGGDPFVFGRGGEEVQACLAAGVPVDVVPGLTSVVSVPQAAGIPVTHRGVSSGFHVVNGQGEISTATTTAICDPNLTTVVLMGVAALPRIVSAALAAGANPHTPVAIVERGHTVNQRTTHTTLGSVTADAHSAGVSNPAVIVIGEVARAGLLDPLLAGIEQEQL